MKKSKTAGKTAHRKFTLTIDGCDYDALDRVAQAMNRVPWCDTNNTAQTVFREFVAPLFEPWQLRELILTGIATGEGGRDAPEPLHSERIAELADSLYGSDDTADLTRALASAQHI